MNTKHGPAAADIKGETDLGAARRVLALETQGLEALNRNLDHTFTDAVEAMATAAGRIVVTGMGKSGHIARKIASTLSAMTRRCRALSVWRQTCRPKGARP